MAHMAPFNSGNAFSTGGMSRYLSWNDHINNSFDMGFCLYCKKYMGDEMLPPQSLASNYVSSVPFFIVPNK